MSESSKTQAAKSSGITLSGLLGVAFVVLKLCHVIDWSWWWVLAPFWGLPAFYLAICIIALLFAALIAIIFG